MQKEKKLTIAITTYNSDIKFLTKNLYVLYSFINRIEIIINDDCSEIDNFNELKKLLDENFPLIKLYRNEKNLNIARNALKCMKRANTKFVKRFDSDDSIIKKQFERFLDYLDVNEDFDIGINSWYYKNSNFYHRKNVKNNTKVVLFNANLVFKTKIVSNFKHPKNVKSYLEDKSMILFYLSNQNIKLKRIDIPFYIYKERGSSGSKTIYKNREKYIDSLKGVFENIKFNKNNFKDENSKILVFQLTRLLAFYYLLMYKEYGTQKISYLETEKFILNTNPDLLEKIKEIPFSKNYLKQVHLFGKNVFIKIIILFLF